jgi:hypothetical protein
MPAGVAAGTRLALRASLIGPAAPAVPGAYDFARVAWFQGLGATGKALGEPTIVPGGTSKTGFWTWLGGLRNRLSAHIHSASPGAESAIARRLCHRRSGRHTGRRRRSHAAFRPRAPSLRQRAACDGGGRRHDAAGSAPSGLEPAPCAYRAAAADRGRRGCAGRDRLHLHLPRVIGVKSRFEARSLFVVSRSSTPYLYSKGDQLWRARRRLPHR